MSQNKKTKLTCAIKFDGDKPKLSLIPQISYLEVGKVFTMGANKYDAFNWALGGGFNWTRLTDAALRHISAFLSGEDIDSESNLSHISHAICCLMMLRDTIELFPEKDDRFDGWKKDNKKKIKNIKTNNSKIKRRKQI